MSFLEFMQFIGGLAESGWFGSCVGWALLIWYCAFWLSIFVLPFRIGRIKNDVADIKRTLEEIKKKGDDER